jgi:peptide/nickel transport system substrate-binding protein
MSERGIGRITIAIILVVIIVLAGVGAYYASTLGKGGSTSSSTTSQTSSSSSQSASQTSSQSTSSSSSTTSNTLVVEEGQQPDSMDPAVEFTTPGNEITFNVYQGLVTPYLSSNTQYIGVLAQNWTSSADQMNWNFTLRQGVTFSNGDPFNAYVMWYSLYRTLVMNQAPSFILGQNFANTTVSATMLNSMTYSNPSAANLTVMEEGNQSFQVLNKYEIALHVGYGYNGNVSYSALLSTLTAPCAFAVDPIVVLANGGVQAGQKNSWMETNAIGTGFYLLNSWVQGQSVKLVKNPNYWGNNVPAGQLNYAIQPAILTNIIIYYKPASTRIADLKSGFAQIIGAPDVTEASSISSLKSIANVNVSTLPIQFGSASAAYFVFMNPYIDSQFSNIYVREAVTYAINYSAIIQSIFSNLAQQWIGPVPPGFPYYNQTVSGLTPYSYNATQAALMLAKAGYKATLPNGTMINSGGSSFPNLNFVYSPDLVSESEVAPIIQSELGAIGIPVTLVSMPFAQYTGLLFSSSSSGGTDGFGISYYSEDYTASQDYVTALSSNNYTGAPTLFVNETTYATNAASATDNATLIQAFQNVTKTMFNSYQNAWLYVPDFLAVNYNNVVGMVANPTGSCAGYFMYYNTVHYS